MKQEELNNISTENNTTPNYRLSKPERETYYNIDEVDNMWYADSSIPKDIHKLEKQGWILVDTQYYPDGEVMSKKFKAPRNCLSPRTYNPDKPKKVMSDAQKLKCAEALKASREAKQNK